MAFKFEKLLVWQKALDLADAIYQLTVKCFPKEEMYILTSQIRRAADSVSLNIAEGSTGQSNVEVVGCLYLGRKRGYIISQDFDMIYKQCEEILVMINGLKHALSKTINESSHS
jgi:four helix bundle protein